MTLKNLTVNQDRLWDSLMEMAKIGPGVAGGNCRLALSDFDREGRDLFVRWCQEAGCSITVDKMGNIFARRPGTDPSLAPVTTGSHLDTQPTGGRFDGVFGVLAGLEVIRTLNDNGIETTAPIEVSVWTNEEGSRFAPAMIASGVFAGVFDLDYGHSRADVEGKTIGEELDRIGYLGDQTPGEHPIRAFFEAHIEQGPILEAEEKTIGVVTGAQGQRWFEATLTGSESHAGTTPMNRRKDALVAASKLVTAVNEIALAHPPHAVTTVGMMQVSPNSRNTIPGSVFPDHRPAPSRRRHAEPDGAGTARCLRSDLRSGGDRGRAGEHLVLAAHRLRFRLRRGGEKGGGRCRLRQHGHHLRGRPRRLLHQPGGAHGHDLRALRGRDQPQRERDGHAGRSGGRLQRAAARHAGAG